MGISSCRTWCVHFVSGISDSIRFSGLQFEEFAKAFRLLARDGDFGGFFVVHFEHEAGLEPGHDFLDVVDVNQIGAVRAPERVGIESSVKLLEGAVIRGAFEFPGGNGDKTTLDGSKDEIFGVHKEHSLLRSDHDFGGRSGDRLGNCELRDQLFEAFSGACVGFDFFLGFLDGLGDSGLIEWL